MPRSPKGEKRPADAIGNAVMIARIATGGIEDITTEDGKNAGAGAHGRQGTSGRHDCQATEGDCEGRRRKTVEALVGPSHWNYLSGAAIPTLRF
jgi:hypothetical protein